ncbi:MAG: helix-turn-helix domain-containing protein [Muribaculaceae bacterium]|nr:helix-turn-helix domain-containing protein [Muribaculaceae bacterium]
MNENIYMLPDGEIYRRIGQKLRKLRLRQNITQMSLAEQAQISVSSVKKIENGEIGSFDSLIRVIRILGELDVFGPFLEDDEMSPNEYLKFVESKKKNERKRASKQNITYINKIADSEW